jgi:hypothetical protein
MILPNNKNYMRCSSTTYYVLLDYTFHSGMKQCFSENVDLTLNGDRCDRRMDGDHGMNIIPHIALVR